MSDIFYMSVNGNTNILNCKDCTKCRNEVENPKSSKNVTMSIFKPSSDIKIFFKGMENQREQVAPEQESNLSSNDIN